MGSRILPLLFNISGQPRHAGQDAMVADDDGKFTEAVVRLLTDPKLCESLSREARRKAEAEYSWDSIATEYESLYREAQSGHQA